MSQSSPQQLDEYLSRITNYTVIEAVSRGTGISGKEIAATLSAFAAEARFGYSMIAPRLRHGSRILEVGSGLGLLSGYLKSLGFDVTPIEPCANGFDLFAKILAVLVGRNLSPPVLGIKAEELSLEAHGGFDFIYSVNVLEHIPDLEEALAGMARVLIVGGHMLHTCPNYTIPYEPHFALPLIPFIPRATRWLLPKRITDTQLWQSLNFVTAARIRRIAAANGCAVAFRRGMIAVSLMRLDSDAEFVKRQGGFLTIYRFLKSSGLLKLIRLLPPTLNTPMEMELRKL
jgi:SAM-dependent methyltransferase